MRTLKKQGKACRITTGIMLALLIMGTHSALTATQHAACTLGTSGCCSMQRWSVSTLVLSKA